MEFQAVLSNPPYIHRSEISYMNPEAFANEPDLALFHEDPPALYKELLLSTSRVILKGGFLIFELSPFISNQILEIARPLFPACEIIKDYSGKDRFLRCYS